MFHKLKLPNSILTEELQLLNLVLPGHITLSNLSQQVPVPLITEAKHNGFMDVTDSGSCSLTAPGKQRRLFLRDELLRRRRETIRYWITTGIAAAALVKSFLPEVRGLLALLWPPAGQ